MRKILLILISIVLVSSCIKEKKDDPKGEKEKYISVESISLNKTEIEVETDATIQLVASILPTNATDQKITWISSDPRISTVDENGLVTSKVGGRSTIIAKTVDGIYASCVITAVQRDIPVEDIVITPSEKTIKVGQSFTVSAKVVPFNASHARIGATIPGRNIIDMTPMGEVIGVAAGTAVIRFTDELKLVESTCTVTVID